MTLEDETGHVNIIIHQNLFEKQLPLIKTASLLGVTGHLQSQEGTTHLIVHQKALKWLKSESRDN